jgi:hypothetical protein
MSSRCAARAEAQLSGRYRAFTLLSARCAALALDVRVGIGMETKAPWCTDARTVEQHGARANSTSAQIHHAHKSLICLTMERSCAMNIYVRLRDF